MAVRSRELLGGGQSQNGQEGQQGGLGDAHRDDVSVKAPVGVPCAQ